jgi:hypothetical protein
MNEISWADRDRSASREEFLLGVARDVEALALALPMPVTWLAGDRPADTTAESLTEFGILIVNDSRWNRNTRDESEPRLLDTTPREIVVAVGVHEYVHFRLGGAIRRALVRCRPDADRLLSERIIPDWIAGRIRITRYAEYFERKDWVELYGHWEGSHAIEAERAVEAVCLYFRLVAHGKVRWLANRVYHSLDRRIVEELETSSVPIGALDRLYDDSPDWIASLVVLGLELAEKFARWLDDRDLSDTRWALEEGFANYVASNRTGVSLYEINRWARQDHFKLEMAERIEQAAPTESMVKGVQSIEDLFAFGREIGVIR